jgi:hypothetical protein
MTSPGAIESSADARDAFLALSLWGGGGGLITAAGGASLLLPVSATPPAAAAAPPPDSPCSASSARKRDKSFMSKPEHGWLHDDRGLAAGQGFFMSFPVKV